MIKVKFMLGAAADRYEETGKVPTEKWANENDGSVFTKTFQRKDGFDACKEILRETYVNNWAAKIVSETLEVVPHSHYFEGKTYPLRQLILPGFNEPAVIAPEALGALFVARVEDGSMKSLPDIDYYALPEEFSLPNDELGSIVTDPTRSNGSYAELYRMAQSGEWRDRAIVILENEVEASDYAIASYVNEHWQNLRSDKENIREFKERIDEFEGQE